MWKELISTLDDSCKFSPPASSAELLAAEKILGSPFPISLKKLLLDTNGVFHARFSMPFLWDLETILAATLEFRKNWEEYGDTPLDDFLFFSEAGNGDWFAFQVSPENELESGMREKVLWRDHETGVLAPVAASLEEFIKAWLTDKLDF